MTFRRLERGVLHIEAEGCVVNVREGLEDQYGRSVTSIEVIPDDQMVGDPTWRLYGGRNNRVVKLKTVRNKSHQFNR